MLHYWSSSCCLALPCPQLQQLVLAPVAASVQPTIFVTFSKSNKLAHFKQLSASVSRSLFFNLHTKQLLVSLFVWINDALLFPFEWSSPCCRLWSFRTVINTSVFKCGCTAWPMNYFLSTIPCPLSNISLKVAVHYIAVGDKAFDDCRFLLISYLTTCLYWSFVHEAT